MAEYSERERQILDEWPTVTAQDIERINDLFPHYLFFRRGKEAIELWASCCGHKEIRPYLVQTETPEHRELLAALEHKEKYTCPWCGKTVTVISLSKAGKRKSLSRRETAVLLHSRDGVLYADAIAVRKDYEVEAELTARPMHWVSAGYRFAPGEVMQVDHQWGAPWRITSERGKLGREKRVQEPFWGGAMAGHEHYTILNRDVLKDCPLLRYCGFFDRWQYRPGGARGYAYYFQGFISYLTAAAIYPRQVELLSKAGLWEPLSALIWARKKFAGAMCWEEPDIRKSLGLNKKELAWFLAVQPPMEALEVRNYAKRHFGKSWELPFCADFCNLWGRHLSPIAVLRFLKNYRLDPERFLRYLESNSVMDINECTYEGLFETYRDYLDGAYHLGRCMEHSKVLWPEDLMAAHDEATAEWAKQQAAVKKKGVALSAKERRLKYEFEHNGLLIRFPVTGAAIRREGDLLKHCVGGYADRHMNGVLSILFLRRADRPDAPYVTIEMHGNQIAQIHGWDDERTACADNPNRVNPRVRHKYFLDMWLKWLRAGSPRDENGAPKLPKAKKTAIEGVA